MKLILKYFPGLSTTQQNQLAMLQQVYNEWNNHINVISRKDIGHLYERHVLHSLAISKFKEFEPENNILDSGTGGGFPGIPLAIVSPAVRFQLVDSIGKKIRVVKAVIDALQLKNCIAYKARAEEVQGKFDFIVSRAVGPMRAMCDWTGHLITQEKKAQKGWIFLKGGDLREEIAILNRDVKVISISDFFEEEFFLGKHIIFVPA
ncbi:MAG: 16S rRNA (guanine(527)-N(7))-methyltransferase RsmG [Chitinophagales bacterium]|nr:16S rRNA (guanine(527)-N(7))-methyltransferase RsmG [Chitinophagales bacterium]